MSLTTKNAAPAAPAIADRTVPPRSRKAAVLRVLLKRGHLATSVLCPLSGQAHSANQTGFRREVLEPLEAAGLIGRIKRTSGDVWHLTPAGREQAVELGGETCEVDQSTVAQRRTIPYSSEPPPRDTYRCPRPDAYDYRRCPSRMGNTLVHRDGRVEEAA